MPARHGCWPVSQSSIQRSLCMCRLRGRGSGTRRAASTARARSSAPTGRSPSLTTLAAGQQSEQDVQVPPDPSDTGSAKGSRPRNLPGLCIDDKDVKGASKRTANGPGMLVRAFEMYSGVVPRQVKVVSKTSESPALRELALSLALAGRTVTALHARVTAHCLQGALRDHGHQGQPARETGRPWHHGLHRVPDVRDRWEAGRPDRATPLLGQGPR